MVLSNSALRIVTALIAAPVVVGLLYIGAWPFSFLVVAAALTMQWEFYRVVIVDPPLLVGVVMCLTTASVLLVPLEIEFAYLAAIFLIAGIAIIPFVMSKDISSLFPPLVFGVIYPGSLLVGLTGLRALENGETGMIGFWLALAVILFVWATDVGAYYVGKTIGQRKLLPSVSPNKTWEGSIGGILLSLLVAAVFAVVKIEGIRATDFFVLALLSSVLAQIGDLVASSFKRAAGVKDFGTVLPGHGGLMDRLDGLLLASPAAYLYVDLVICF